MQAKCIIIDDEPLAVEKLSLFITKVSWLQLEATFNDGLAALNYIRQNPVELLFLDIQMEEFSGIQFMESLKERPFIIITSAYSEYALQGYEFDVTDYLLKPFGLERFISATDKVFQQLKTRYPRPDFLFLKTGYSIERIDIDDILYIEGMNEYLRFVTPEKKYMTLQSFRQTEPQLPADRFIRVHKSFIVALHKIEKIERHVILIHGQRIPIGKNYKEQFYRKLAGG